MSASNAGCLISMNSKRRIGRRGLMKPNDGYIMQISSFVAPALRNQSSSAMFFFEDLSIFVSSTTMSRTGNPNAFLALPACTSSDILGRL